MVFETTQALAGNVPQIFGGTTSSLTGFAVWCFGYRQPSSSAGLQRIPATVLSGNDEYLQIRPIDPTHAFQGGDLASPCIIPTTSGTPTAGQVVGIVQSVDSTTRQATVRRASSMRSWLDGMVDLSFVRNQPTTLGPYAVWFALTSTSKFCIDVPGNTPNQSSLQSYPCHYAPNQLWYLDRSGDANRPRLVSASSGKCIDVPNGVSDPAVPLQQFGCHGGDNQRFNGLTTNQTTNGPWGSVLFSSITWRSKVAPPDRCVSAPSTPPIHQSSGVPLVERLCANNRAVVDQFWTFERRDPPSDP